MTPGAPPPDGAPSRAPRRSVAGRILASFALVLVAFAATLGVGIASARRAARDAELLRRGYVPLELSLASALQAQNLVGAQLNHIIEAKNPADARAWIETERRARPLTFADVRAVAAPVLAASSDADARALGAELLRESSEIEAYLAADAEPFARLFAAIGAGDMDRAEALRSELVAHEVEGARRIRELSRRVDRGMDDRIAAARAREREAVAWLAALAALTLVVGVLVALRTSRLLGPLAGLTARAQAVARGDLTPRDPVASRDEIGELAATFERMVAAIARARSELVQAERLAAIGKMAAHVTHEIRNPLSALGLNVELLEETLASGGDPREAEQLLRAIRSEIERLSALSEQYLRVARRPAPRLEPADLAATIEEVVDFVRPEIERAGATLAASIDAELPRVAFDDGQIRQALLNLVRNAREAMAARPGAISVRLAAAAGGGVDFTIDDEGPGIDEEARERVFEPFFTTKERGTGLGLAVTRDIVEAHGGTIACSARAPRGTRFLIHLPAAD